MTTDSISATTQSVGRNLIAGRWSDAGERLETINPSTGQSIGTYASAGTAEAHAAINSARKTFDETDWSRDPRRRSRAINELADNLERRVDQIALSLSRENGKRIGETQWEVSTTVDWLRYAAASSIILDGGRSSEVAPGVYFQTGREAMGVIGIITPWNSPVILSMRSIGPALAAGCTMVVKMPGQTALTNTLVAEVIAETTSIPEGVVSILTEGGNAVAPALVDSPDVDMISYTGSTHVGRAIAKAGADTLKRLSLELGGKTPLIVFDDADLDVVMQNIVAACTLMNGQFCLTGSRLLVQRSLADKLRPMVIEALSSLRVGPSEDPTSDLGPLIDAASARRVDGIVADAASYGTILVRGGVVDDDERPGGAYYQPSLVEVDRLDVPLVQDELFGPVQTFEIFDDEADAVRMANGTAFGLGAAVFTTNEWRARRVTRNMRAGFVWTNCWGVIHEAFEEGGLKQSGYGLLCGPTAITEFQDTKLYAQVAPQ
ncbi:MULTISPECIES: aldehyde dehydrogenase family protein [Tsukamurella]|uniref:Aldehyde dehydrogenase family protein n=2 Tax=Tsukamurella TaxID=2060 RepID=A0A5C5RWT8_9ACTN|nr:MULTISPECIES: aldehyde dehydrogenase family protein [Tsukamurella]NMD56551.1 aldehyde dehydrogenase family protein [Tsukamurella columbiensis]TWS27517.1 aldehyde dehydrogenase family protein [Tsukamurella conjunctivitidis]